jgi:bifunctional UDP-N-acetylglucosamine pyrophosphorylase/glucosamine-1-phosphate N-acetyltransferase
MSQSPLHIVILAAGKGTRMRSAMPKVLQRLADRPMLAHVIDCAKQLKPAGIHVVYGHGGEQVQAVFHNEVIQWVEQREQRGTGHAVAMALPALPEQGRLLVLYGDTPLISADLLEPIVQQLDSPLTVLSTKLEDPSGYGRIKRIKQRFVAIVEQADATPEERAIKEVNSGIMLGDIAQFRRYLAHEDTSNAQGEWYLTDMVANAVADDIEVQAFCIDDADSLQGVNDRNQLACVERLLQQRYASELMAKGVSLADPCRFDLRGTLHCGRDVFIDANVLIEGDCELADGCHIGPFVHLKNVRLGANTVVASHSVLENAQASADAQIGPFARLRPGTRLGEGAKVGNFVETKNAEIGKQSKVNHLSYIGDAQLGQRVNVGAGTITCNYDGANKHLTTIGDDAFIGSDTQLVAPVTVGAGATIGAGTTLTKPAPAGELTLSRARQASIRGWTRPTKTKS